MKITTALFLILILSTGCSTSGRATVLNNASTTLTVTLRLPRLVHAGYPPPAVRFDFSVAPTQWRTVSAGDADGHQVSAFGDSLVIAVQSGEFEWVIASYNLRGQEHAEIVISEFGQDGFDISINGNDVIERSVGPAEFRELLGVPTD
ncbi:MAG: hypothetical protein AB7Q00_16300 [Phycisphaerales bacterium]